MSPVGFDIEYRNCKLKIKSIIFNFVLVMLI